MEASKGIEQAEVMRRWHEQKSLSEEERDVLESQMHGTVDWVVTYNPSWNFSRSTYRFRKRPMTERRNCIPVKDMTFQQHFLDQLGRGQPPLVALHNAAQAYAESLKPRDCSQYADETEAWSNDHGARAIKDLSDQIDEMIFRLDHGGMDALVQLSERFRKLVEKFRKPQGDKPQDSEAVELLREARTLLEAASDRPIYTSDETDWHERVRKFLEGKE